jgi:hypothetical protein
VELYSGDDDLFEDPPLSSVEVLLGKLGRTPKTFTPGQHAGDSTRMISEWEKEKNRGSV